MLFQDLSVWVRHTRNQRSPSTVFSQIPHPRPHRPHLPLSLASDRPQMLPPEILLQ